MVNNETVKALPVVARLYQAGRYRRASVCSGAGEPLVRMSDAAAAIEQQAAKVEALEREVERLRAVARDLDVVLGRRLCDGLNASGQPRCMKLAEAEKDARRYRWLRENNHMNRFDSRPVPYAVTSIYWKVGRHQARTMPGDRLDAAIDAAMQPVRIDHGRSGEGE